MKSSLYISSVLLSITTLSAQQTAYFETTIYVEDATGNIDSIVIGHDQDANGTFNPQFGEFNISTPFDSIFEVRAAHWLSFPGSNITLSKTIIGPVEQSTGTFYEPDSCYLYPEATVLFIHAVHQPVTVRWDRNTFNEPYCRRGSIITSHFIPMVVPEWWLFDTAAYALSACMAETDQYSAMLFDYGSWGFYTTHEVEGTGIDTIYAMLILPAFHAPDYTPCHGTVSIAVNPVDTFSEIRSYPNPVSGTMFLDTGSDLVTGFQIFDLNGKQILSGDKAQVDMRDFPPGIYAAAVMTATGYRHVHKFVKQ